MSPHGINSLVGDLVEMAKATERLPQLEAELDRANTQIESYAKQVQDREMAIISYKQEIDDLHAKVRSLEVERDDASFRVLEAEDMAAKVINLARTMQTSLADVMGLLDPPKPEPISEPQAPTTPAEGPSATTPMEPSSQTNGGENTGQASTVSEAVHSISEVSPGQSESSPTASTGLLEMDAPWSPVPEKDVGLTTTETSSAEPIHGPYFGKHYVNHPIYVSLQDWISGEGTEEGYYGGRSI